MLYPALNNDSPEFQYKLTLDWRLRVERRIDRDFSSSVVDDRDDLVHRIRPGVEWTMGKEWSGAIQYQHASDRITLKSGDSTDEVSDASLAYATYKGDGFETTVGRQKINIGSERLIGTLEWVMAGRSFDGLRVKSGPWDLFAFKVGVAFPKPRNLRMAGATYAKPGSLTQLFFKHDEATGSPDTDIVTLAQSYAQKRGALAWETEGALQSGDSVGKTHKALALHFGTTFECNKTTKWFADVNAASGGSGDTSKTFDNLLPTNHKFYGSMDLQSWRNMQELAIGVEHKFDSTASMKASWRRFGLYDGKDAWYGAAGGPNKGINGVFKDPTGQSGRDVGQEFDLEFFYKPNKQVAVAAGWCGFVPGKFVKALNSGDGSTQTWGYFMVQYKI